MFEQLRYLKADLRKWKPHSFKELFYVIFETGVWVVVLYRISRGLYVIRIPIARVIFRLIGFFIYKFYEVILGVNLTPGTSIGPGLYIGHTGAIVIHHSVKAGKNLSLGTGVVIGTRGVGNKGAPELGDNVYIGVGAKLLGKISVGNGARIGANAVVFRDVPDRATVVGIPGKVVKIDQEEDK